MKNFGLLEKRMHTLSSLNTADPLTRQITAEKFSNNIPLELRQRPQWMNWRYEIDQDGKPHKVPYNALTGYKASDKDPAHWVTFTQALSAYLTGYTKSGPPYAGIGFSFSKDDPYTGIDADLCVIDGKVMDHSVGIRILEIEGYKEISVSQTGLHVITRAQLPGPGFNNREIGVEMYDQDRFFAFSGDVLPGSMGGK